MLVKVRYWHIADVPLALTNVCFEGKNGHDAGVTPLLMSRWVISGIDAETLGGGLELLREALFVCSR